MKRMALNIMTMICTGLLFSGCGGGGGSIVSVDRTGTTVTPGGTSASGVASGFSSGAKVKIYSLGSSGQKLSLIKETVIDANGGYLASLGSYQGAILIEVSGDYVDPASGGRTTFPETAPMRAAVSQASGTVSVAVTPLTEIAVQKVGSGGLTVANISAANNLVSDLFEVDIINTQPVRPAATDLQDATQAQRDYTLDLTAIGQMTATTPGATLQSTMAKITLDISGNRMSKDMADTLTAKLTAFLADGNLNRTGIGNLTGSNLIYLGSVTATVKLQTQGLLSSGILMHGIEVTLILPNGVTMKSDSSGKIISNLVTASGMTLSGSYVDAQYDSSANNVKIALINAGGFGLGEFAIVKSDVAAGVAPNTNSFTVSDLKIVEGAGVQIAGVAVRYTVELP